MENSTCRVFKYNINSNAEIRGERQDGSGYEKRDRERDEKKSGTTTSCSPFVLVYFNEIKMS